MESFGWLKLHKMERFRVCKLHKMESFGWEGMKKAGAEASAFVFC